MTHRYSMAALATGILSGGLAFYLLHQKSAEIQSRTTPITVLVASRYIPAGMFLKKEMVEVKSIPKAFVGPSAIRDIREVEGFQSQAPFSTGEQLLSNKFGIGDSSLSTSLLPGKRAYTLEVNETNGIGGLLKPGDHIDILAKYTTGTKEMTSFAFQNIPVLATGRKLGKQMPSEEAEVVERRADYGNITLSLSPEEAETLMFLEGRPLRLVLRAAGDEEPVSISPQTESDVLSRLGRSAPKASGKTIEIIRRRSGEGVEE